MNGSGESFTDVTVSVKSVVSEPILSSVTIMVMIELPFQFSSKDKLRFEVSMVVITEDVSEYA